MNTWTIELAGERSECLKVKSIYDMYQMIVKRSKDQIISRSADFHYSAMKTTLKACKITGVNPVNDQIVQLQITVCRESYQPALEFLLQMSKQPIK